MLPSPLLGPAVWSPVAGLLRERGWSTVVPALWTEGARTPGDVVESFASALRDVEGVDGAVAVPHSNAGLYVPPLVDQLSIRGVVYVDALVPPSSGVAGIASPEFLAVLAPKADVDGVLPPWMQWWPEESVIALLPDAASRAVVEAEQQRLPLSFFRSTIDVPSDWDVELPSAYVAFADTYAEELALARARDWPVHVMDGGHLHMLVDPRGVADALEAMIAAMQLAG